MSAHATDPTPRRPLQFTLRSIFLLTTLVAVSSSACFAGPGWLKGLCLVFMLIALPVSLTVALIYGRGYLRTFCIGGLVTVSLTAFFGTYMFIMGVTSSFDSDEATTYFLVAIVVFYGFTLAAGVLAMTVRWIVERPQASAESSSSTPPGVAISSAHAESLAGPHFHCAACGQIPDDGRLLCPTCHQTAPGS